jgi:serine/threonine protein kinase/Tfp pilus assembly protein PilF
MSESASAGSDDLSTTALLTGQRQRWQHGKRVLVEEYLREWPALAGQPEAILDLLYHEILLREARGEMPGLAEYVQRFPQLAEELARHFEVHAALDVVSETFAGHGLLAEPAVVPAVWPVVPGYEIQAVIGRGGMGVVYKARHQGLNRLVALKMLGNNRSGDPDRLNRFRSEAEAVARLQSPHIVQIHDIGGVDGHPYFALEFIEGGSLAENLKGTPAPRRQAAALVETLARAIHHAHERGIIHRDLKPANILLQRRPESHRPLSEAELPEISDLPILLSDFQPKITDFGLAKFLEDRPSVAQTQTGDILGTPSYMAPEQTSGISRSIGPATDIYALGSVLYEMLTGRPPFRGVSSLDTLQQVRQAAPVAPRRLQPGIALDLETVCLKCLEKEPAKRYPTALALADDLARYQAGRPIKARAVGQGEKLWRWCLRKPAVAALVTGLVLALLVGSSGVVWQWQRARQNAADFRQERDTANAERQRAENHLQLVHDRVELLYQLGRDLMLRPGQYQMGQKLLEQALAFYQELLPEEGKDPRVRLEAAKLYHRVGRIYIDLGRAGKAAETFDRQESLLTDLLKEKPGQRDLRIQLADSHRWRANAFRDQGKMREAREAYEEAARLHEGLMREFPGETRYQWALANTFLNATDVLSRRDQSEELESLFRRAVELDRAAVRATPHDPKCNFELALALQGQGIFFMEKGLASQAEADLREAVEIYQMVVTGGHLRDYIDRYLALGFADLGKVLRTAGKVAEAEQSYQKALDSLKRLVEEVPESALRRAELAMTLAGLADLLEDTGHRQKAVEIRRQVILHYEMLKADFPEEPEYRRNLVTGYLQMISLLWQLGRQKEAVDPCKKALEVDPEDAVINKELAWFLATNPEPRLRQPALAERLAAKAVAAQPESAELSNALGVALYRNGNDKAAVAQLEMAMNLGAGGNSYDWFFLAMAQWRLGDRDKARASYERAVKWMAGHRPQDTELCRFRAEAGAVLGEPRRH